MSPSKLAYQRVLLKLSGEVLSDRTDFNKNIDPITLNRLAKEITAISALGLQIGIVVGGGNLFRGIASSSLGIDRITGDQMGMLATIINTLAIRDALKKHGAATYVMSAIKIDGIASQFERQKAINCLKKNYIVLFAGGTGNPLVSTDAAASLRGIEINADILLKATRVDGVYSSDPTKNSQAILYKHLTYNQVLKQEIGVMDLVAFYQCRDHGLPIRVFNINQKNILLDIIYGKKIGTLIDNNEINYD